MKKFSTPKEIGALIRNARHAQGLTGAVLGEKAGLSQSKISKIESGNLARDDAKNIQKLIDILHLPQTILQQMSDSPMYGPSVDVKFFNCFSRDIWEVASPIWETEKRSETIRVFCNSLIPSLLQTTSYQSALHTKNGNPDTVKVLKATSDRQIHMWESGHEYYFVIAETALYTSFAGSKCHFAQLAALERYLDMPNVSIGIIPTTAGMPPIDTSTFVVFGRELLSDSVTHREMTSTNSHDIDIYIELFAKLQNLACYGEGAADLIRQAAAYFRPGYKAGQRTDSLCS